MKISVNIKSGTGGHHDKSGCDKTVEVLEVIDIPRIGEKIEIGKEGGYVDQYIVTDVVRHYFIPKENGEWKYGVGVTVYVIPIIN